MLKKFQHTHVIKIENRDDQKERGGRFELGFYSHYFTDNNFETLRGGRGGGGGRGGWWRSGRASVKTEARL